MYFIRRLVGTAPVEATTYDDDEIYPLHMLDNTLLKNIIVTWTLRFNDVLHADRLHNSLSQLLEIGDWRKLGGRLRQKPNGDLEIHSPKGFTTERPAVSYSQQAFDVALEEHPLAKTLPQPTPNASLHPDPRVFHTFSAHDNAPSSLQAFLTTSAPILSLRITSFNNATLIGLSFPHAVMDIKGQQALLHAWSLVVAGREEEVPRLLGAREDAMEAAVAAQSTDLEEHKIKHKLLRGLSMLTFGARFAWDILWNRTVSTRIICLPKEALASLRARAQKSIPDDAFISDHDILTAWCVNAVATSLTSPRPITALHVVNARFRLSSLINAPGVYIQNMAVAAFAFLSTDFARGPLGPLALENRRRIKAQATEPQLLASLRDMRQRAKEGCVAPPTMLYSDSDAVLMPFTNWERAEIFKSVDFGPAVVRVGQDGKGAPGMLVYHHGSSMQASLGERNVFVVYGKDLEGNSWIRGSLLPAAWVKIEESMKDL